MKPIGLLLLIIFFSLYSFATVEICREKHTVQVVRKKEKANKNITLLALKAVQAIPEKETALPEDYVPGLWLFKF